MTEPLVDQIMSKIEQAVQLYHRLILVVGPAGAGKTTALQAVGELTEAPLINVNLNLSLRMLDLTEGQRVLQLSQLLGAIVNEVKGELVLLDNIEILFDPSLKQDPLRLLQGLSRDKTVVVAWTGSADDKRLTYGAPYHSEYRQYQTSGLLIASPQVTT